jgi:bifunctional ADP-heptose synthase (sugar kinase/adenylyltransferase)
MIIGFQCSSFDMLHAGHVTTMLKQEKEKCDYILKLHYKLILV